MSASPRTWPRGSRPKCGTSWRVRTSSRFSGRPAFSGDARSTSSPRASRSHSSTRASTKRRRFIPRALRWRTFRAPASIVAAESEALGHARRIVTSHTDVARLFGARAERLEWVLPPGTSDHDRGDRIVFLGPIVARRGIHALREAMRAVDRPLHVHGADLERGFDWRGVPIVRAIGDPLAHAAVVVAPAWVEHEPRGLLRAVAHGIPVIASHACGVDGVPGVVSIAAGDSDALIEAIERLLKEGADGVEHRRSDRGELGRVPVLDGRRVR